MNFEDKVLALFDNGRRSAVYVAGYQSARAQAAAIAAEADRLIAEMVVENADLKEQLSAKDAELERVRSEAQMLKRLVESLARHNDGDAKAAYLNVLGLIDRAALASPAAEPATDTDVGTKAQQLDSEDQDWWG